jgi:hypothetical protein
MTWIKTKPVKLEAWYLADSDFAGKEYLERVTEWVIARGGVAYQRDGQLYVLNAERLGMTPHAGDWIIKRDGEFIVCTYRQFNAEYEMFDPLETLRVYSVNTLTSLVQFTVGAQLLSADLFWDERSSPGLNVVVGSIRSDDGRDREPAFADYGALQAALTAFLSEVPSRR